MLIKFDKNKYLIFNALNIENLKFITEYKFHIFILIL